MPRQSVVLAFIAAAAALGPVSALAQSAAEAKLRDALRSATAQLRTLEDEKAAWKTKEAALEKELEALRAQPKTVVAPPKRSDREVAEVKKQLADQTAATQRVMVALAKCQEDFGERAAAVRSCEDERGRLAPESAHLHEKLAAAEAKNERLFRVGKDIIDWLNEKGMGAALAAREPFLGRKRVQLENEAQNWEDRLVEQRVKPLGTP
jgi:chromosome segregation ATPase